MEIKIQMRVNWSAAFLQLAYEPEFGIKIEGRHIISFGSLDGAVLESPIPLDFFAFTGPDQGGEGMLRVALRNFAARKNIPLPMMNSDDQWDRVALYNANLVDWPKALHLLWELEGGDEGDNRNNKGPLSLMMEGDYMHILAIDGQEIPKSSVSWWMLGNTTYIHDVYVGLTQARIITRLRGAGIPVPVLGEAKI
jgi:hypothetical protein